MTLRLRARIRTPQPPVWRGRPAQQSRQPETRPVYFAGRKIATRIYDREALPAGRTWSGPAILTEYSATTVVPPGARFRVDRNGNLLIELGQKKRRPG